MRVLMTGSLGYLRAWHSVPLRPKDEVMGRMSNVPPRGRQFVIAIPAVKVSR
jgi:hypothetical protein